MSPITTTDLTTCQEVQELTTLERVEQIKIDTYETYTNEVLRALNLFPDPDNYDKREEFEEQLTHVFKIVYNEILKQDMRTNNDFKGLLISKIAADILKQNNFEPVEISDLTRKFKELQPYFDLISDEPGPFGMLDFSRVNPYIKLKYDKEKQTLILIDKLKYVHQDDGEF